MSERPGTAIFRPASPTAWSPSPAPLLLFFCLAPDHRLKDCSQRAAPRQSDAGGTRRCRACKFPGECPADCLRRRFFANSYFRFIELDHESRSYCAPLSNLRELVSRAVPRPPGRRRLRPLPRLSPAPANTHRRWMARDGRLTGVADTALTILGPVALKVHRGPLKAMIPFAVVVGVNFAALLGMDFLYTHDIYVSLAQHALLLEVLEHRIYRLLSPHPPFAYMCRTPESGSVRSRASFYGLCGGPLPPPYRKVNGRFLPKPPSPDSRLTDEELAGQLRKLLEEFVDYFNHGSRPRAASSLLQARRVTADRPPVPAPGPTCPVQFETVAESDAQGITEPGSAAWGPRIVWASRLCCRYREIYKPVRIAQQRLPRTTDNLASFLEKCYFLFLCLPTGFHQIAVADANRPKTSCLTPDCPRQHGGVPLGFASILQ
ncbi:hypothetical protein Esti_004790 [Eimeria stiedai]